jgi:hypothetical protein
MRSNQKRIFTWMEIQGDRPWIERTSETEIVVNFVDGFFELAR